MIRWNNGLGKLGAALPPRLQIFNHQSAPLQSSRHAGLSTQVTQQNPYLSQQLVPQDTPGVPASHAQTCELLPEILIPFPDDESAATTRVEVQLMDCVLAALRKCAHIYYFCGVFSPAPSLSEFAELFSLLLTSLQSRNLSHDHGSRRNQRIFCHC